MSSITNIIEIFKKNTLLKITLQIFIVLIVYFSIRTWQSADNIKGQAPVILATSLNNEKIDSRDFQDKPLLIHFWATWCPICQFENDNIENIGKDYQVISIASWSEGATEVQKYLKDEQLNLPIVIIDEDAEWAKVFAVNGVPTSFIVDKKGVIQFIEKGYTSEMGLRLRLWWLQ
ncbi:MAG: redoxin domain-containing protein [Gammaproteobacteria bacterium]|nr:redoxin domain-containing protein [Gammaproteobacteria bacterium]